MPAKTRSSSPALSPAGLLRVALCGCGQDSRSHVQNLLKLPDVDLVALADASHENCTRLRDEELVPRGRHCSVFHSLEEQLRLAHLDAVVVSTPQVLHHAQVRAALRAGVHVLLETPMTTSVAQARDLVRLAQRRKRVLALAYPGPYTPEFSYIRRMHRNGLLGEIRSIQGTISQDWLRSRRGSWRLKKKDAGGGILFDSGSNLLAAVLWLTELQPIAVFAFTENLGQEVDVLSSALIRFENGALATLAADGDSRLLRNDLWIHGTQAAVHTTTHGDFVEHYVDGQKVKYPMVSGGAGSPEANFVAAIRGREDLLCPADYGLKVARLVHAIYTSARTHKMVRLAD